MDPKTNRTEVIHGVAGGTSKMVLDVLGPTVEFLTPPAAAHDDFCVMRGVIPPGVAVPLHSHDATEVFYVLSGTKQVLTLDGGPAEWVDVRAGDYVHVPRRTRHAHRNVSGEPLIELVHGGITRDRALVDDAPAGIQQVEGDGAAAVAGTGGPGDPRHRRAVAVPQRGEPVDEPAGQAHHPPVDHLDPDAADLGQPGLQVGYLAEADRAVFEPGLAGGKRMPASHSRRCRAGQTVLARFWS